MNLMTRVLINYLVAVPFIALLALQPIAARAAGWSGWARCELDIRGPGYENKETHTWIVTNVTGNTTATRGPGTWSAAGRGTLDVGNPQTSHTHSEWAINGSSANGSFGVSVNNGVLTLRPYHSQLGTQGGISGYSQWTANYNQRPPTFNSFTEYEWAFPLVQGPATSQAIIGSGAGVPAPGWGSQRVSGSTMTVACQWAFANGSTPAPPPPVPPQPVPVPVPLPQQRWAGTAECEVTVTASGYQDRQVHSWQLRGSPPSASGGVYVHPAIWRVKGKGSFLQSQGKSEFTANWGTSAEEKAPFAMFFRQSDGKLIIQPGYPQPRRVPGGVRGTQQQTFGSVVRAPVPFSLDAIEFALAPIEADPGRVRMAAKSQPQVAGWVTPMQPAGATVQTACTWQFDRQAL